MPCPLMGNQSDTNSKKDVIYDFKEREKYLFLLAFSTFLFVLAFFFDSPRDIWYGNLKLLKSPANLVTDYFALANVGASLVNSSVMMFLSIAMIAFRRLKITGPVVAALFTVAGFSLFGKNLYNSLPIILGVICYGELRRLPFQDYVLATLFGTSLGPLVSEISFSLDLKQPLGIFLGALAGFGSGFVILPLANHFINFHKGFNLYNMGFTAGIIGTFFIGVLRNFGVEVDTVTFVSNGNNPSFSIILYFLFAIMFLLGLVYQGFDIRSLRTLLKQSGILGSDFITTFGFGLTLINMALLGILTTTYVLIVEGELNGPVIGGIFTVVGFGAYGKHLRNTAPVLLGVSLVSLFNFYEINSVHALLAALFGTTIAPIAGQYGMCAGLLAGGLHMAMVMNISNLHAGMNLYNNGFSGGFVAAALVPIFESVKSIKQQNKQKI